MSATTAPSKRADPEPGTGNSSEVYYNEKLGCGLSCAYGFFRVPVSAYDLAVRPDAFLAGFEVAMLAAAGMTVVAVVAAWFTGVRSRSAAPVSQ